MTLVADERATQVETTVDPSGAIAVSPGDLHRATGWELRDEGLCRGDVCVPVRDRAALAPDGVISLATFADALRRPLATEPAAALAVLGEPAEPTTGDVLSAPAFILPDVDGRPVSLDDYFGRKRLLVFWSSW